MSACNYGYMNPCPHQHFYSVSVAYMEGLKLVALVVKYNAAVCEHAINIKDKTFDIFGNFKKFFFRDIAHFYHSRLTQIFEKVICLHLEKYNSSRGHAWAL